MRLEKLCQLNGISGDEKEVRDFLYSEYKSRDLEIVKDRLGSIFGMKKGRSLKDRNYKVMISSNLDESGGIVSNICSDGLLEFLTIGLYDKRQFEEKIVKVLSRTHKEVLGHVIKRDEKLYVNIGAKSFEEVLKKEINIGDFVILDLPTVFLDENQILSKNLSNRAGLEVGLQVLDLIKMNKTEEENNQSASQLGDNQFNVDIFVGGISHSVTGQRGAITATTTIKPDISIVIDAAYVKDYEKNTIYIRDFDKSMIPNQKLRHYFYKISESLGYKTKGHIQTAATDASFIHKSLEGTPTLVVVLPLMCEQSTLNVINITDMENLSKVIVNFLKELTPKEIEQFGFGVDYNER